MGSSEKMNRLSKNKGTALVITLFVIAVLTTLAISFSYDTGIELNLVGYSRDSRMAHQIASSGVNLTMALLDQDEDKNMDNLDEPWAKFGNDVIPWDFEEDSTLNGRIIDENSKLNLNKLLDENGEISDENANRLQRVFTAMGLEESQADPILDWLDEDNTERMEGVEDSYYQSLSTPYHCADGPFLTIYQLRLVKGITEIVKKLEKDGKNLFDYFTIYGDGKVNINTASSEVLQSLHNEIDENIANSIIEYRENEPYTQESELKNVTGIEGIFNEIQPLITVKSNIFAINMKSIYRTSSSEVKAFVQRSEEDVKIVYWQVN